MSSMSWHDVASVGGAAATAGGILWFLVAWKNVTAATFVKKIRGFYVRDILLTFERRPRWRKPGGLWEVSVYVTLKRSPNDGGREAQEALPEQDHVDA